MTPVEIGIGASGIMTLALVALHIAIYEELRGKNFWAFVASFGVTVWFIARIAVAA